MDRSEFPHLTDSQFESVRKMAGIFGRDALQSLVMSTHTEQVERVSAFDAYEQGLIAHVQGNLQDRPSEPRPMQPKPLRLKVQSYDGKEGENLHFWTREVQLAMDAALLSSEQLRVAFALSNLGGRAKTWAYTCEATTSGCFTSWAQLSEQLRAVFLPASYEYRQRSHFLACKQGKRELHEYIQEMQVLAASLVGNPLPAHIKVTVFMDGLRVGPARTQLFRVQANTMEAAVQVALQEEYSHKQARTPVSAWHSSSTGTAYSSTGQRTGGGPVLMDLGLAEQNDIRCFGCGKIGHMKRACPAGGQRRRFPPRLSGPKGRWQRPRYQGQGNVGVEKRTVGGRCNAECRRKSGVPESDEVWLTVLMDVDPERRETEFSAGKTKTDQTAAPPRLYATVGRGLRQGEPRSETKFTPRSTTPTDGPRSGTSTHPDLATRKTPIKQPD